MPSDRPKRRRRSTLPPAEHRPPGISADLAARAPSLERLTDRERIAVLAYTDPSDPDTYLNQSRSLWRAAPSLTTDSVRTLGSQTFSRVHVQNAVTEILDAMSAEYSVRVAALADIALGRSRAETETETYGPDGELLGRQVSRRPPGFRDRLTALKAISDATGESAAVRAQNELLSDELRRLGRRMLGDARSKHGGRSVGQAAEKTGDRGEEGMNVSIPSPPSSHSEKTSGGVTDGGQP